MGNWHISIDGIGSHDNWGIDVPYDADKMMESFVQQLRDKGHSILNARFTSGGAKDFTQEKKNANG